MGISLKMDFIKLYCFYVKTFFKARAEYRVSFFLGLAANFITYFLVYVSYWIITGKLQGIDGWSFEELTILYGISLLTYAVAGTLLWYTVYNLSGMIIKGTLDVLLTRPMNIIKQLICYRFGDTFLAQILVTILFLGIALYRERDRLDGIRLLYLLLILVSGVCLQMAGMLVVGAISFWTLKSEEIGEIFYYKFRKLTEYPLSIFPSIVQTTLTFVLPWAFINYYPSLLLLNKAEGTFERICGYAAPFVGVAALFAALKFFYFGLRHYSGAGN